MENINRHTIVPTALHATKFKAHLQKYFEGSKGSYIHHISLDDHMTKINDSPLRYSVWLKKMLAYLSTQFALKGKKVVDIGCGTGELTVWMNLLGYRAAGIDVHDSHIKLAKILAHENGLSSDIFIHQHNNQLPFKDKSIDVLTLFSVLEHLNDTTIIHLLPELKRICRGVIYILVPNKFKPSDDHTGLWFVPWMPRKLAERYIKSRGEKYKYHISLSGEWDVYYRTLSAIQSLFNKDFEFSFIPDDVIFPSLEYAPKLSSISKKISMGSIKFRIGIPLPIRFLSKMCHISPHSFYRYLNFVLIPKDT